MNLTKAYSRPYIRVTAVELLQSGKDIEDLEELNCIIFELQYRKAVLPDSKVNILTKIAKKIATHSQVNDATIKELLAENNALKKEVGDLTDSIINLDIQVVVLEHLIEKCDCPDLKVENNPPPIIKPSIATDIKKSRKQAIGSFGFNWEETGLLGTSGYSVGVSSEIKSFKRREILDYIFLEDDLSDITNQDYKASWGQANTKKRLKKIVDSLVMFARNAKRQSANYAIAIQSWEEDLQYLEATHLKKWDSLDKAILQDITNYFSGIDAQN
jgi:hypothetical protein